MNTELFQAERTPMRESINVRYFQNWDGGALKVAREQAIEEAPKGDWDAVAAIMKRWLLTQFANSAVGKFVEAERERIQTISPYYRENEYGEVTAVQLFIADAECLALFERQFAEQLDGDTDARFWKGAWASKVVDAAMG